MSDDLLSAKVKYVHITRDRRDALETVAEVARRAVDAIDEKPWAVAWLVVAELNTALDALGGSPTEDQQTNGEER